MTSSSIKRFLASLLVLAGLGACAGPDYTPVYFPGADGNTTPKKTPSEKESPSTSLAHCALQLTAKLCVKIKRGKDEYGVKPEEAICADTSAIPIEINGNKISLKGSDFPDIQVQVNIRGVQTPMTINGKGSGDGSKNLGEGTWTPEGGIAIKNFSFFINVLGVSGEIPSLELTTGAARKVPDLEDIQGTLAGTDGKIRIVTSTVLGSLFEAADKFLLGASMQATFDGTVSPALSECAKSNPNQKKQIQIVKLQLDPTGQLSEESLPGGNILEVSKGTFISQGPQDIGPSFEGKSSFKATNTGDKALNILLPAHLGPFYLTTEGKTVKTLSPKSSFKFQVAFQPDHNDTPKAGPIKQSFPLGPDQFYLSGVALEPKGSSSINRADTSGQTTAANVDSIILKPLAVPASTVKGFFQCQKVECDKQEAITQCQKCTPPDTQGCLLLPINTKEKPVEEMTKDCKPANPESLPMMNLDLSGAGTSPVEPIRQIVTLGNQGVTDLKIESVSMEEVPGSQSTGQFKFLKEAVLVGSGLDTATPITEWPLTLPPYQKGYKETLVFMSVTYSPTDLIGFDGKQAATGVDVTDKAILKIKTDTDTRTTQLVGRTRIQDVPDLEAYFGTATGMKSKANNETFAMEEVTATTEDMAVPTLLKLADIASSGLRITEIKISGKDASFFEWLDTTAKVSTRQPASGKGKRCSIPVFDAATGRQIDERFDLNFVALEGQGFDLKPGAFTLETMPLFGCVNFHRDAAQNVKQRLFQAELNITALKLDAQGKMERNPDNSYKQTTLLIKLVAAIDPIRGKMVLRITQSVASILNPTAPVITAMSSHNEVQALIKEGKGSKNELGVMLGAMILDPFDEMEIADSHGNSVSRPGDGITAVFRQLDTRPSSTNYEDPKLFDFASLLNDSDLPQDQQGIFNDYGTDTHPLPKDLKVSGWRIFTGALSYPGPFSSRSPIERSECEIVDPCIPEEVRKFTDSGVGADGKGACAFFYATAGTYDSPAFAPVIAGERVDACANRDQPQKLLDMNTGHYSVDGSVTIENVGLRFWGPTFLHNPGGSLGRVPPLDEVFHLAFTTEVLKPKASPNDYDVLPDIKLDFAKQHHKMNLDDTKVFEAGGNPTICSGSTLNRTIGGKKYSSWRYFAPLISKDESGETPAGCQESGTEFTGGTAFLHGQRVDPATGNFTVVSAAKFGSKEDLTIAFKDISVFIVLNGWLCNPEGDEKNMEGAKCFDTTFNEHDAGSQISIMGN
ncbi:MAG: hypothetical protein Q7T03_01465 [Deltaproteobacteria bacterium]|nr:hypothetical protein [Deltaproteobacteria bacterium]